MKTKSILALSSLLLGFAAPLMAGTTTYQVTGPVLAVDATKIVIQKDTEKWEIAREAGTKVTGELQVGSKVTVMYTMTATSITAKPDKAAPPAKTPSAPAKPVKKPS